MLKCPTPYSLRDLFRKDLRYLHLLFS